MADLGSKVKSGLDEARTLLLGAQVLLGFAYRSFFEVRAERALPGERILSAVSLGLMLLSLGLLLLPTARHRLVERGRSSGRLLRFLRRAMAAALLPFAISMGLQLGLAGHAASGLAAGVALGAGATAFACAFWYGGALLPHRRSPESEEEGEMETPLEERVGQVLTEARVVLPGAQTLLGFQLAIIMMESFEKLPPSSKLVHLVALALIAATTVFLIAPAAYHRLVERGHESERFHRFASLMVVLALASLAPGLAGDVFVVARKLSGELRWGVLAGCLSLAFFYGLWFGLTLWLRAHRKVMDLSPK